MNKQMKIIKQFLIGLGILFLLFIILATFISIKGNDFKEDNIGFVAEFLDEFSQDWKISSVSDQLSNEFLIQIKTPNGEQAMQVFKRLGKLENVRDFEMGNFRTSSGESQTGVLIFKAKFNNAETIVTITLNVLDGIKKVYGLNINTLEDINFESKNTETST